MCRALLPSEPLQRRPFPGLDYYGNISMTLSGTHCLLDVDQLIADGTVTPAFGGLEEACGKACMDWYAEYYHNLEFQRLTAIVLFFSGIILVIQSQFSVLGDDFPSIER